MTIKKIIGRMVMSAPDQNGETSSFSKFTRTPAFTSAAVVCSLCDGSGPMVTFVSLALFFVGSMTVKVYSRSLIATDSTCGCSLGASTSDMNSLKATWVLGFVLGSKMCQIAKNIVAMRIQRSRVLCDCFTSRTSQGRPTKGRQES